MDIFREDYLSSCKQHYIILAQGSRTYADLQDYRQLLADMGISAIELEEIHLVGDKIDTTFIEKQRTMDNLECKK